MSDETRIDPERARAETERLRRIAERFQDTAAHLKDTAARYDGCWGGDELGEAFAKNYVPNAEKTVGNVGTLGQNVATTADQIDKAVDALERTDKDNAGSLD